MRVYRRYFCFRREEGEQRIGGMERIGQRVRDEEGKLGENCPRKAEGRKSGEIKRGKGIVFAASAGYN
jgi:hypothetical protein